MRSGLGYIMSGAALLVALVAGSCMFQVHQTEQALVLRLGAPVEGRGVITTPGLHFKAPFIDAVLKIDNRILDLETPKQEVMTANTQRLDVDSFVRYKITDPLLYRQAAGNMNILNGLLVANLNSAVRSVLGEATQAQIVREDRAALMAKIRDQVNEQSKRYGVQVVDARLRRVDLPRERSESVFDRMRSERAREANEYRAQGEEQSQIIRAKADRDVTILRAEAQQKAEVIRGEGDSERNRIFAQTFGQDPEFFGFYRSMQAYEAALKSQSRFVVSPDSEFFRYFGNVHGKGAPAKSSN